MKRAFAIVLLSVHLFNIGGYNLVYQYFIHRADAQMSAKILDSRINEAKLFELKIPVHFETIDDDQEYRMVAGQIEYHGTYYNYMKMKTTRDTMFFVCLPNLSKTRLVKASINTAKEISDIPVNKKGHDAPLKKASSANEYNFQAFNYSCSRFGVLIRRVRLHRQVSANDPYIASPGKPPNSTC